MNAEQNARVQMIAATIATCTAHGVGAVFSPINAPLNVLMNKHQQLDDALAQQQTVETGATQAKAALRQALEQQIIRMGDILVLHATLNDNPITLENVRVAKSVVQRMSDGKLIGHATKVVREAQAIPIAELTPLGLTAANITSAETAIGDFTDALGTPRHLQAEAKLGTEQVAQLIDEMMDLLEKKIDPAAKVYGYTDPTFYSEYLTAREIVDPGYNVRELTVNVRKLEGGPLIGAQALITPGNIEKSSGTSGTFFINNMEAGTYSMVISAANFEPKTVDFTIVDNQATVVNAELTPLN